MEHSLDCLRLTMATLQAMHDGGERYHRLVKETESICAQQCSQHHKDSDCTTLDENDMCTGCQVYHGPACSECGGRGFHVDGCSEIES